MTDRSTDADLRRSRMMCYLAATIFGLCGASLLVLPVDLAPAIRWVLGGFNVVIALAVFLYGRQLTHES